MNPGEVPLEDIREKLDDIIRLTEQTLEQSGFSGKEADTLCRIRLDAYALWAIVREAMELAKIKAGDIRRNIVEYDLPSLLKDIVSVNLVRIGGNPLRFSLRLDPLSPRRLSGDALNIRYLLSNLLSGFIKSMEEGAISINASCVPDGDEAILSFVIKADAGMIDLSVAGQLAEIMGGSLSASGAKESVVRVELRQGIVDAAPVGEAETRALYNQSTRLTIREERRNPPRTTMPDAAILVVDDIQANLLMARGLFRPYGMEVDGVFSGKDAVTLIDEEKQKYDLILIDHLMPDMDGIETFHKIRGLGSEYAQSVPIVALTANVLIGSGEIFREAGFQDFLAKPMDIAEIDRIFRTWIPQEKQVAR
jgi:CheY-like chemotaxis protein